MKGMDMKPTDEALAYEAMARRLEAMPRPSMLDTLEFCPHKAAAMLRACKGQVSVDELAQIIRTVDGSNDLGAGALAEAILAALEPAAMLRACKGRVRDEAKDARISALSADRDEALNQLDSARHSLDVLESRVAKLKAERDAANSAGWVLLREIYSRDAYMSPELKAIHNRLARHQKETDT